MQLHLLYIIYKDWCSGRKIEEGMMNEVKKNILTQIVVLKYFLINKILQDNSRIQKASLPR